MTKGITTGAKTRATIVRAAADIASVDGLEGLSIGRLATELGIARAGYSPTSVPNKTYSSPSSKRLGSDTCAK